MKYVFTAFMTCRIRHCPSHSSKHPAPKLHQSPHGSTALWWHLNDNDRSKHALNRCHSLIVWVQPGTDIYSKPFLPKSVGFFLIYASPTKKSLHTVTH